MNKMDALNQQFVCRVCRALNEHNAGLYDMSQAVLVLNNIRNEYLDEMIEILEEKKDRWIKMNS